MLLGGVQDELDPTRCVFNEHYGLYVYFLNWTVITLNRADDTRTAEIAVDYTVSINFIPKKLDTRQVKGLGMLKCHARVHIQLPRELYNNFFEKARAVLEILKHSEYLPLNNGFYDDFVPD